MIEHLKSMAVFACVVEEGSFRQASIKLSMSPSVVSHHLSQLEAHIGSPLLYRSTRKLSLTDYGRRFYPYCQEMTSTAQKGLNELLSGSDEPTGNLNIALPAILASGEIPSLIAQFCQRFPKVQLNVDFDNRKRNLIEEGFDLSGRIGWLEDSNLRARKITDIKRIVCVSQQYLDSHPRINTLSQLSEHQWIKTEIIQNYVELFNADEPEGTKYPIKQGINVKGANVMREMLLANFGLAVIPEFLVRNELENGTLVHVLPEWHPKTAGFYFVWADSGIRNPLVKYFIDFIEPKIQKWLA
ncbi:LysR family transcriptional regulator [Photobacterium sagamiensis]|uniref:LysR family transcriptional regulator n=1 Tax=Photobacterium sagamiensis TaxID=2910241 RepID=UPI003D0F6820